MPRELLYEKNDYCAAVSGNNLWLPEKGEEYSWVLFLNAAQAVNVVGLGDGSEIGHHINELKWN